MVAGPSNPKTPKIENSELEKLGASLKEVITSEMERLIVETQKELLERLEPRNEENENE